EWWSWCDALFMAPPAFAKYYRLTGDEKYLDYLTEHWWKTSEYLYAQPENLFYRDDRFFDAKSPNGTKVFWSRGNGWVLAAIARIRSEEHTSELQSRENLVCRLLLEKKKTKDQCIRNNT